MYSNKIVVELLNYLDKNLYKRVSMEELERVFYFNKDYLMRLFKRELGLTIITYMNKKRIYLSLSFLRDTKDSIMKIAMNSGFTSQEYYSEMFSKIVGVNPTDYKMFIQYKSDIPLDTIEKLRKNLVELDMQLRSIEKYKKNIKGEEVKKLSIFM